MNQRAGYPCAHVCLIIQSFLTLGNPWTVARQVPLSMGILQARTLEWVPCPSPEDLPNIGIKHRDQTQVSHIAGRLFTISATREAPQYWSG